MVQKKNKNEISNPNAIIPVICIISKMVLMKEIKENNYYFPQIPITKGNHKLTIKNVSINFIGNQ